VFIFCPKCGSPNTWIETDSDAQSIMLPSSTPILRCRCGLASYGQGALNEAIRDSLARTEREKLEKVKVVVAIPAPPVKLSIVLNTETVPIEEGICALSSCEKDSRPKSKYCSRDCSNKNARARYKVKLKHRAARAS
jgi:hypothetical protein